MTIFHIIIIYFFFLVYVANREKKMHSNSWKRRTPIGREVCKSLGCYAILVFNFSSSWIFYL